MRDRFFFPLALIVAAGMVLLALSPGIGRLPTGAVTGDGRHYTKITVADTYLNKVYAGGKAITRLEQGPGGKRLLYIEADAGALAAGVESGPHFRLAADLETQYAGFTLRITVRARPADDHGAMQMEVNYDAGRVGESGWQTFDLQPGFADYSFEYRVPRIEGEQGVDNLGIRPVVPEKSRALIVESIVIDRLDRWGE